VLWRAKTKSETRTTPRAARSGRRFCRERHVTGIIPGNWDSGRDADLNEVAYGHGHRGRVILWSSGSPVQHFPFPIRPWKVSFVRVNDPPRAATPHISNQGSALDTVLRSE